MKRPVPPTAVLDQLTVQDGQPRCLGRFQVVAELGRGGMGVVLEARDPELRRRVAVKVIASPARVGEAQLARFVSEAQITSQLEHPNIVPVYENGVAENGELYFVMRKVEGRSLLEVLRALRTGEQATVGTWTPHRLLTAFVQVCHAVAYAHDRGVLHRDLKPANVMLGRFGEVQVMDWGVARLLGENESPERTTVDETSLTRTMDGAVIGTPGYMSPEQAKGQLELLDGRSDVWSLGAILYELLTLQPAFSGDTIYALIFAASELPVDPRVRAPERRLSAEISEVCLRALAPERDQRFAGAAALGDAVEAYLAGSARRAAARHHVDAADGAWARYLALTSEREVLRTEVDALERELEPWLPLEDKAGLLTARRRLGEIGAERAQAFSDCIAGCEQGLSQDPGNPRARARIARSYFVRFEEAEAAGQLELQRYYRDRVLRYDDGPYAAAFRGTGAVTLRTDPPGAEVLCERFEQEGLIWSLVERRSLGRSPLESVPLEMGSYLLTIRAPGKRDTRYPVLITRARHWDGGDPIPLFTDDEIGPGMVYVPEGPFRCGGDAETNQALPRSEPRLDGFFVSVFHVTAGEYCDFLNGLADPEEAWRRSPRQETGLKDSGGQYWDRPAPGGRWSPPEVDRDGDRWDPMWPAMGICWEDAVACARWKAAQDGLPWTLPTERQWEKAARGVDGRSFPWGDEFDASLCKVRHSRPGRNVPEPVGVFETDVSVYGMRDAAGTMREWCADASYAGDPLRRPVRGGSWHSETTNARCADRYGSESWVVATYYGFRLARPLPS